jgi:pantetheine-phosphate adenylyltransferase
MDELNIFNNELVDDYFRNYHPPYGKFQTQLDSSIWYFMKFVPEYLNKPDIYHNNKNHIEPMLKQISVDNLTPQEQFVMFFFAVFHDAIHDECRDDQLNVRESIELMHELCNTKDQKFNQLFKQVESCIDATRYKFFIFSDLSYIQQKAVRYDIGAIIKGDPIQLQRNQMLLFKEYQHLDFDDYVNGTVKFLKRFKNMFRDNCTIRCNIDLMISMVESFQPKIGVFAGSFNPFHIGHLNILEQAERVFDKVIIANGYNANKDVPEAVKPYIPNQFDNYDGLLTAYLSSKKYNVTLVRGLRNGDDLQYEENMRRILNDIDHVDVTYFLCDKEFTHISSSAIRELSKYGKGKEYIVK